MRSKVYVRKYKTKVGETRYFLEVHPLGQPKKYIQLGPVSKRVAEERRIQTLHHLYEGSYKPEPEIHLFFSEFVEKYFLPWAKGERSVKTIRVYAEQIKPLLVRFRGFRLNQILRRDIEHHFSGLKVSGRTKNVCLSALRLLFNKAVEWNYLAQSPMEGIRRFPESTQGSRALTPEELAKIFDGLTTWQRSLIRVMVNSGMRPGEVANLKFQDIDWEQNRLTVANDKTRKTKNRKSRIIPMNPDLRKELIFLKEYLPLYGHVTKTENGKRDFMPRERHQMDFVFCKKNGSKVSCVRKALSRAFENHGIQGVTPHGLRKTFCSQLARAKVHPKVAQTLMGHSDISLTMKVYTEVDDDQLKEAVNLLPSLHENQRSRLRIVNGEGG